MIGETFRMLLVKLMILMLSPMKFVPFSTLPSVKSMKFMVPFMCPSRKSVMPPAKLVMLMFRFSAVIKGGIVVKSITSIISVRGVMVFTLPAIIAFIGTAEKHQGNE